MTKLAKELSLYGLIMVAVGASIGSGIFLTPSEIAGTVPSPVTIIAVWVVGGLVSVTGALTYSELSTMFPGAGGVFIYLKEAYGDWVGFLFGWSYLLIITSGAIAGLALAFARYLGYFIPMSENWEVITGIIAITVLSGLNVIRAKYGEFFSNVFTTAKIIGILFIILAGFLFPAPVNSFTGFSFSSGWWSGTLPAFGVALVGVLFSYGGWQHASFLAGEVKNPTQNVPKAMITGALVVIIIYILINISFLSLMTIPEIAGSRKLAADAVGRVFPFGGAIVAATIAVSTLGTIGIYTLTTPRVVYAMAESGIFFKGLAKVHPKFRTPMNAIILQGVWSIALLLFWGTFAELVTYCTFADWIFYSLGAFSIFIFRRRMTESSTGYRTPWYPVTPLIFFFIGVWFVINTLISMPLQSGAGLVIILIGLPVYFWFKKNRKS
ncbi:MAG: amino acid permease [Bacteroidia bacterium]|nr:MAG: amino acid permease [Bacteroidia bacterium]